MYTRTLVARSHPTHIHPATWPSHLLLAALPCARAQHLPLRLGLNHQVSILEYEGLMVPARTHVQTFFVQTQTDGAWHEHMSLPMPRPSPAIHTRVHSGHRNAVASTVHIRCVGASHAHGMGKGSSHMCGRLPWFEDAIVKTISRNQCWTTGQQEESSPLPVRQGVRYALLSHCEY